LNGLNYVLTRFGGNILETVVPDQGEGGEIKQCCHTFYLKKRFWDAVYFTHMLVDSK
jgi:hypothetical protein